MAEIDNFNEITSILKITDIEQLKQHATDELSKINDSFERQMKLLESLLTINDLVKSNSELQLELGEVLGYNYGMIDSALNNTSVCIKNLTRVSIGEYDDTDPAALGMFIFLWQQFAIVEIKTVYIGLNELESIEASIIGCDFDQVNMDRITNISNTIH